MSLYNICFQVTHKFGFCQVHIFAQGFIKVEVLTKKPAVIAFMVSAQHETDQGKPQSLHA